MKQYKPSDRGYRNISGVQKVWLTGSRAIGRGTSESDVDLIVQVAREVYDEPMSLKMRDIEDAIWAKYPKADVFFTPVGNPQEMVQLPAFTRAGGKVEARIVKSLWRKARVIGRRRSAKAIKRRERRAGK